MRESGAGEKVRGERGYPGNPKAVTEPACGNGVLEGVLEKVLLLTHDGRTLP